MDVNSFEILYVRHADADSGLTGNRDVCDRDVTPFGEKQLELLSERFSGAGVDAVLASPLVRTVKTAAAVANAVKGDMPVELIPELIEKGSTPGYTGLPLNDLKEYYGSLTLCSDKIYPLPGPGEETETKEQCLDRARAVVEYLRNRFDYGQRIVVVSHGIFAMNFYQAAMGIVNEYGFRYSTDNTAVTKLKFTSDGLKRIVFHNDVSHLIPLSPDYRFRI